MNEPSEYAETIRTSYQRYLQGRGGIPAKSVARRLQPDAAGEDTLAGMRGPYLQALPIANWSDTGWKSFARSQSLHPNVIRAFHNEGFQRLYDFQERSVETILGGEDTVITAATGRGKTEAWLIPILDKIVKGKRSQKSDDRTTTKALLFYPTKALAQDQFKRLVQILYRINRNLRKKEWVTVGIYDGDTPRHIYEDNAQGYLNRTFEHFGCPGCNEELEKCRTCGQGVFVERSTDDFRLRPDKPECETDQPHHVPLDFVRLTRSGLMDEGADIVLTNPDTVNYRLFNINAETEQDIFVYEPEFLVFDEVHTYDGLLGSYTATLVKRLRRLRQERDCGSLQVIGSSATVDNDTELFRQVSGAKSITSVSENPRELSNAPPEYVPPTLYRGRVSVKELLEAGRERRDSPPQLGEIHLGVENSESLDNDRLRDRVADDLFDALTVSQPKDPAVQTYQTLHTELRNDPRPPTEFRDWIATRFRLDDDQAETLLDNFQTVGEFSGLLESRHHMFSWPLDGFYACSTCTAVYRSPRDVCPRCDSQFITRATYCTSCHEEYLVANACSRCDQLVPYVHTEEGLIGEDEAQTCPYCLAARNEEVPMHQVLFQPTVACDECGARFERSATGMCEKCGTPGVPLPSDEFVCRNPDCEATWPATEQCPGCGSDDRSVLSTDGPVDCPECGIEHESDALPGSCECGTEVTNTRLVMWTCSEEHCDAKHVSNNPPETCRCGDTGPFVKAGLYDVTATRECASCGEEWLPGGRCDCSHPKPVTTRDPFRRYKTWTAERKIESPLDISTAIPCDHDLWSTVVGDAFTELMRSPTNVAVTTSQYLLRNLADREGFESAKLLAFSDSHRDMKDLDRSFTEPETDTVLDQLALCGLELASAGIEVDDLTADDLASLRPGAIADGNADTWVSLATVLDTGYELLEALESELAGDSVRDTAALSLDEVILGTEHVADTEAAVKGKLERAVIRHVGERRTAGTPSLASDGFVDVQLDVDVDGELRAEQCAIVRAIVDSGNGVHEENLSVAKVTNLESTFGRLAEMGILRRDDGRLSFAPEALEVATAGQAGVAYDPHDDEYYTSLQLALGFDGRTVACSDSLSERAAISHPRFSERAFTATNTRVAFLLSQLYYGSTPKMDRREIEHQFREEPHPNFLSSGPTMELGVDIGSLDSLLLNGTPPNMNAYLQRVGRAGRSSHSSLVHSVSQRNPIDYYYYEEPTDLITAKEQPVPLNEHNERVLRISLAWAVLDYVAATFTIPWNVTRHTVSGGEEVKHRDQATQDERIEAGKFTQLLARSVDELELDSPGSRLRPLGVVVEDNETDIRQYLESLFDYAYCTRCYRRYDRDRRTGDCHHDGCDGRLVDAHEKHAHLVDDAIEAVHEVYVDGYRRHVDRIDDRIETHESRRTELESEHENAPTEEQRRLQSELEQLETRIDVLDSYLGQLAGESYLTVLEEAFGEYAFNLRSVTDSVDISVVDEKGEPERIGGDREGRASRLALSELHPCAVYLHDRRPHVVSRVFIDDKKSEDLRETVASQIDDGDDTLPGLAVDYVCPDCGAGTVEPSDQCSCGSHADRQERRLFALDTVEATLASEPLPNETDVAGTVYQSSSNQIQSTFARRETEILSFEPTSEFEFRTSSGSNLGTLSYGSYEILEYTQSFRAKYKLGGVDNTANRFELCDEPDCPGVVYTDRNDDRRCTVNADHHPDEDTDAVFARLGYEYETEGLRLSVPDHDVATVHAFGHGLRLGLQKLSGVTIRDVNEYVANDHVDVFDSQEGGAAVARQLVKQQDGNYENFQTAMSLIETQFDCQCDDGCPRCLYQYGCAKRNDPHSLDREVVHELAKEGIQIVPQGTT